ncbi:hypothetical protein QQX98_004599 [Neonectria punicea]|uniref:Uncharacterized protein n=1 Tax=Neonectria punicea TaxID=979145 RepID=A0ABR1H8V3_9HYPO
MPSVSAINHQVPRCFWGSDYDSRSSYYACFGLKSSSNIISRCSVTSSFGVTCSFNVFSCPRLNSISGIGFQFSFDSRFWPLSSRISSRISSSDFISTSVFGFPSGPHSPFRSDSGSSFRPFPNVMSRSSLGP